MWGTGHKGLNGTNSKVPVFQWRQGIGRSHLLAGSGPPSIRPSVRPSIPVRRARALGTAAGFPSEACSLCVRLSGNRVPYDSRNVCRDLLLKQPPEKRQPKPISNFRTFVGFFFSIEVPVPSLYSRVSPASEALLGQKGWRLMRRAQGSAPGQDCGGCPGAPRPLGAPPGPARWGPRVAAALQGRRGPARPQGPLLGQNGDLGRAATELACLWIS